MLYALTIEAGDLRLLIDPTRLLLHPLALQWFRIWQLFGWTGRSLIPLQILNALAGAACVGLTWSLAFALSRSFRAAAVIALGFTLSGGLWLLSVEAEFVTVPFALQILALWCILVAAPEQLGKPWYALLLGVITSVAVFGYLTSAFLILVVLVGFWTSDLTSRVKLRQFTIFLASLMLIIIPVFWAALNSWTAGDPSLLKNLGARGSYGLLQ